MKKNKKIWMIISQLKKLYRDQKVLFVLVVASTLISTYGFFFFTDYFANYVEGLSNQKGDRLCIEEQLSEEQKEQFLAFLQDLEFDPIEEIVCEARGTQHVDQNQVDIVVKGEYHRNYNARLLVGSLPDWSQNDATIVIDEFKTVEMESDKSILEQKMMIDGTEYKVQGVCSILPEEEVIVPLHYYLKNFSTDYIEMEFNKKLTRKERKVYEKTLNLIVGNNLNWESPPKVWEVKEFWGNFWQVIAILVVIGINIAMLIEYLVFRNKRKYCVFSICGGGEKDITSIIFWQIFIHMWIGTISGACVAIISRLMIGKLEWMQHDNSVQLYLAAFIMLSALEAAVAFGLERKMAKKMEIYEVEE